MYHAIKKFESHLALLVCTMPTIIQHDLYFDGISR